MLDVVAHLLETRAPWDIRAADVAAGSGTTQPNFYSHFRNIQDAIYARVELAWLMFPDAALAQLVRLDWHDDGEATPPFMIVRMAIEFWNKHGPVLRVVHRLHPDDHPEFLTLRHRAQSQFLASCEARIRSAQVGGHIGADVDALLAANCAVVFLDNAASVYDPMQNIGGYPPQAILHTVGAIFRSMLGGRY